MSPKDIAQLYEAYAQDVFRLALSYLGNRQDAEDICQNVFLNLLHKNVRLLPGKEKAYLLTCAANACKNHLTSFWHKNVTPLDDSIVFSQPEEQALWIHIAALPAKYRAVIHLYYYEGYSQDEIAKILKITRTTVQTRMSRAREKLRKELTGYEEDLP